MNKKQYTTENKNLSLLRFSNKSGSHINCIRIFKNNSKEHEKRKIEVSLELLKRNKKFITEAIFKNDKRADIFNITDSIVYEILYNEKLEEAKEKTKSYPQELEVRFIDAKKKFEEKDLD